jgi:hypothetical protein
MEYREFDNLHLQPFRLVGGLWLAVETGFGGLMLICSVRKIPLAGW